jgi:hypothetical protein
MASIFNDGIRYPALSKHKERKSAMIIKPMVEGNFKTCIFKNIKRAARKINKAIISNTFILARLESERVYFLVFSIYGHGTTNIMILIINGSI